MLPPPTCNMERQRPVGVGHPADKKPLAPNTPQDPEDAATPQQVRIILSGEVCTTPKETAKLLRKAIMEAVAELNAEREERHGGQDSTRRAPRER